MEMLDAITGVPGIKVGHYTDREAATGCTVILCEAGAVGGVEVRGAAPGTRETDLLNPVNTVSQVHAVVLSGGSAFGLEAAGGAVRYLEERGYGYWARVARVPIVPAAILFDLGIGSSTVRPGPKEGYAACLAAAPGEVAEGSVGAGTGATIGKILGIERATKGGLGTASVRVGESMVVGALVAVNAFGDVVDPDSGRILAGPRRADGKGFLSTAEVFKSGFAYQAPLPQSTTLAVVATNARLSKAQLTKVAQMAHDGMARAIVPCHTTYDGDVCFALSLGNESGDVSAIGVAAAEAVSRAIIKAITRAEGLAGIPSAKEVA